VLFVASGGARRTPTLTCFDGNGVTGGYADISRALDDPGGVGWPARSCFARQVLPVSFGSETTSMTIESPLNNGVLRIWRSIDVADIV
jgi:hypothetical protein